ncbi:MAG: hypothetical protein HKP40_08495, partial [Litoreibacter sp.]|nr:hypothetical protein [Litoreibacter sp.]
MAKDLIRAHVFSNIFPFLFFKQNSGNAHILDGVELSIGLDVPEDIDVLIVYTRASYSIPVDLPRQR